MRSLPHRSRGKMRYYGILFDKHGRRVASRYLEAKSFGDAYAALLKTSWKSSDHALIVSEKFRTRRYGKYGKSIKARVRYFPTTTSGSHAILALAGRRPEFFTFKSKDERDNALCLTFTHAECVEKDREPKDTTVSTAGTNDSKNGSMSPKTSNGSAKPATWLASLIHFNTGKTSGGVSVESMDDDTWSTGSTAYLSDQSTTVSIKYPKVIRATVKDLDGITGWPGVTNTMMGMAGETYRFELQICAGRYVYIHENGLKFLPEWLDLQDVYLVKHINAGVRADGITFVDMMEQWCGEFILSKRDKNHDTIVGPGGFWYHKSWLCAVKFRKLAKQGTLPEELVGEVIPVAHVNDSLYIYDGNLIPEEHLD